MSLRSWSRHVAAGGARAALRLFATDALAQKFYPDDPLTEEPPTLRAGNAGSLYFALNGETYGPAGSGPEVVKDVVLAPDSVQELYAVADIDRDKDLKRFVAVAQANGASE